MDFLIFLLGANDIDENISPDVMLEELSKTLENYNGKLMSLSAVLVTCI